MSTYHYRAVNTGGEVVEGRLDTEDKARVLEHLRNQGLVPLEIEKDQPSHSVFHFGKERASKQKGDKATAKLRPLIAFTRELATLTGANLPLDRSLQLISENTVEPRWTDHVVALLDDIRGGRSLSDAMKARGALFPNYYIGLIAAGEAAGTLAKVLKDLAQSLDETERLRQAVASSLRYPAIVLAVALLSLIFIFVAVIPEFRLLFQGNETAMPLSTRAIFGLSDILQSYGPVIALAILIGWLGLRIWVAGDGGRLKLDQWKLKLPIVGPLTRKSETARFTRNLGMLLENGVPVLEAVSLTLSLLHNRALAHKLSDLGKMVSDGMPLHQAVDLAGGLSRISGPIIRIGEEAGKLPEMLLQIATIETRDVRNETEKLLDLLTPMIMIFLGLLIAGIVGSMLVTIMSSYNLPLN